MQYLSDEWIEAADAALSAAWGATDGSGDASGSEGDSAAATTTIAYTVTATPQGKVTYNLHVGDDGAGVAKGKPSEDPDATMELDYEAAVAISKGEASPQVAFMQGRLKLGGNVMLLVEGARRLESVGSALASIDGVDY